MLSRIQVNPVFPLFIDDSRERVRLGDFPPTGRVLESAKAFTRAFSALRAKTAIETRALPPP
ncbi:hypothetical protein ACFQGX_47850 [Nonomuraea dietziae]|uniref:hypothetical protein n=1 Tax=Nonomuraea dietziae TaxID=65515 RepID=UPI00360B18E1